MKASLKGFNSNTWYASERFWKDFYAFMFSKDRIERAAPEVKQIISLSKVRRGDMLDLCCGPGRHSIEFARKGFHVVGVDLSDFLLNEARKNASKARVRGITWVKDDMRHFVRPDSFDLVINMFTAFGYFEKKDEDIQVLRNIHQSLRPKGVLVIDVVGKERLAKILLETVSTRMPDGRLCVERHEIFDEWSRIRNEWIVIDGTKATTYTFSHTVYSGQELKSKLLDTGFKKVELYGDLEGSEYGPEAKRLVVVARK